MCLKTLLSLFMFFSDLVCRIKSRIISKNWHEIGIYSNFHVYLPFWTLTNDPLPVEPTLDLNSICQWKKKGFGQKFGVNGCIFNRRNYIFIIQEGYDDCRFYNKKKSRSKCIKLVTTLRQTRSSYEFRICRCISWYPLLTFLCVSVSKIVRWNIRETSAKVQT
jgi:hypothetical protein